MADTKGQVAETESNAAERQARRRYILGSIRQYPDPVLRQPAHQIPGAVLITRDGDGHTSSLMHPSRTRDAIARYLITRNTPPPNTVYPD